MKKDNNPVQGSLFPELEPQEAHSAKPSKKNQKIEALKEENQKLEETIKAQKAEIEALKKEKASLQSKAEAFDDLMNSQSLFPIGIIAKNFGKSAIWLNKYLEGKKIQFKKPQGNGDDVWVLYAHYASRGYTRICWYDYSEDTKGRPLSKAHTYWTPKGMAFIRELLLKDGLIKD